MTAQQMHSTLDCTGLKLFWIGRHSANPQLGAPVSQIHRAGLNLLKSLGWTQVDNDFTDGVPVFAFTTRKGANYSPDQPELPTVRQLPRAKTACLDDKRSMAHHLKAAGQQQLLPPSWDSIDAYAEWQNAQHKAAHVQQHAVQHVQLQRMCEYNVAASDAADPGDRVSTVAANTKDALLMQPLHEGSVFIKHRLGVKGQAVYVAHTLQDMQQLQQRLGSSAKDFIVQQEVPPMLLNKRKFVLRAHVLVTIPQRQTCMQEEGLLRQQQTDAQCEAKALHVYVHKDVVLIQHAKEYVHSSPDAAVHVSSKGKCHPAPVLLQQSELANDRQHDVCEQLQRLVADCIGAVADALVPCTIHPDAVLYHLFGFDCMVDASGKVVLLEVNSYPAIASGTMSAVDVHVYTTLVGDLVRLLVLPLTDGVSPEPGGFVRVT